MIVTNSGRTGVPYIVGVSRAIREVIGLVDTLVRSDCCVLIEGETGTGKELFARRLVAKSRRKDRPFIPVNCAGISEGLFESQFFGHVRGAFTGAEQNMLGVVRTADGGTVFLDEIGEMPLQLQPKLLRVLQEQEVMPVGKPIPIKVDTRVVVGYNQNLSGGNRGNSYYVCQPLTDYELPIWNMPHIFFARDGDSGNPVVQFMFKRLTNQKATTP